MHNHSIATESVVRIQHDTRPRPLRRLAARALAAFVLVLALAGVGVAAAAPASAVGYTTISLPGGFTCNSRTAQLQVPPPRVYSGRGTETVKWSLVVYRWDSSGRKWYPYKGVVEWSSFNSFGQGVTAWHGGAPFAGSTLNISVQHAGQYAILNGVEAIESGAVNAAWIANGGYCTIS